MNPTRAVRGWSLVSDPVVATLCVVGLGLRFVQWLWAPSLWLDEIAIVRNILERGWWQLLTKPLAYDQAAPKGYLLASRAAVWVFGPSDYALRLWPFAGAVFAMLGFGYLAVRFVERTTARVAVAAFACAAPLICYGATAKQYSTDVAAAVAVLLVAHRLNDDLEQRRRPRRSALAVGLAVPWFSQPAALLLAGVGAVVFAAEWHRGGRSAIRPAALILGAWAVSCATALLDGYHAMTPETRAYMQLFWTDGFPPTDPRVALSQVWPWPRLVEVFSAKATFGCRPARKSWGRGRPGVCGA